jgi:hypothetical protein
VCDNYNSDQSLAEVIGIFAGILITIVNIALETITDKLVDAVGHHT